jgi:hypothetical protein
LQYKIESGLDARQIGGRPIPADATEWTSLLPNEMLRMSTRRPVEDSTRFLLQDLHDTTREMIVVAFSPRPGIGSSAIFELLLAGFAKIKCVLSRCRGAHH